MPGLRVALAQVDATVGDLDGNARTVLEWTRWAADPARAADLVVFPEMVLTGYPAEDLVLRSSFVAAARRRLDRLAGELAAAGLADVAVVVGYLDRCPDAVPRVGRPAGEPQNAAAVLHGGAVVARYAKHHLPNYGVFDEYRYFVPGDRLPVVRVGRADVAVCICEDLWQDGGPVTVAGAAGAALVVCINGSPYERRKSADRLALAGRRAREAGAALAYVNLVGGQDELVFDGGSFVVDAAGTLLARAPQFEAGVMTVDLELPAATGTTTGPVDAGDGTALTVERVSLPGPAGSAAERPQVRAEVTPALPDEAEVYTALVVATRDYVRKNRFASVVLGLSGGIDSALVATVAVDALGSAAVHGLAMPSRYSSAGSVADAAELARRLGIEFRVVAIDPVVRAFAAAVEASGVAAENLQARVRGTLLMTLSNQQGHLVLATGNKSELATGYSTLYGDTAGGFAPIKDVPKTLVWTLSRWRNATALARGEVPPIPQSSIDKPPSAELAPGQLDADTLPDYAVLDRLLDDYVERDLGREALVAAGHRAELVDRVIRMVDAAEYKRRQYPPGPKISLRAFGRDRRLPITSRWRDLAAPTAAEPARVRPEQAGAAAGAVGGQTG